MLYKKIKQISEGYINWILSLFFKLRYKELYKSRLLICYSCEHITKNKLQCSICGCILKAKTSVNYKLDENLKSIDGCPKKYW